MVMISNENAVVGDRVYDIVQGYGQIVDTAFGDIAVRFDNGIRITFDKDGNYGGVRRLYWHNPIVIEPPKSRAMWDTLEMCLNAIHSYIK